MIKKHEVDGTLKEVNRTGPNFRELIDKLFTQEASLFSPRPCYDGKKIMYSSRDDLKGAVRCLLIDLRVLLILASSIRSAWLKIQTPTEESIVYAWKKLSVFNLGKISDCLFF